MLPSEKPEVRSGEHAEAKPSDVVVRLLDGRSAQRVLVLDGGRARPPFAIGSRAAWCIDAAHLAEAHVMLAFNGSTLFACAVRGEKALLGTTPLDGRWTEVRMPTELRFGSARLAIGRRAGPDDDTQIPAHDEATRIEEVQVRRLPSGTRSRRDEEATCADEERLRAALALSMQEIEVTRLAEVAAPPAVAARPVTAPFPRPHLRTIKMVLPPPPDAPPSAATPPTATPSAAPLPAAPPPAAPPPLPAKVAAVMEVPELIVPLAPMGAPSSLPESARTWAAPEVSISELEVYAAPSSSMPATLPSDGLMLAAAPLASHHARPSSPTIAIPLPSSPHAHREAVPSESRASAPRTFDSMDGVEMGARGGLPALAASGESSACADPAPSAERPSARSEARGALRARKDALLQAWKQASLVKRASAVMLVPALLGALLALRSPSQVVLAATPERASAATTEVSAASSTSRPRPSPAAIAAPAMASATPPTLAATTPAAVAAASAGASAPSPRAGRATALLGDTRTAERRALDTLASGQDQPASEQYAALAMAHPENMAFREAARILRERAAEPTPRN